MQVGDCQGFFTFTFSQQAEMYYPLGISSKIGIVSKAKRVFLRFLRWFGFALALLWLSSSSVPVVAARDSVAIFEQTRDSSGSLS
jgi:hypothetical protein